MIPILITITAYIVLLAISFVFEDMDGWGKFQRFFALTALALSIITLLIPN